MALGDARMKVKVSGIMENQSLCNLHEFLLSELDKNLRLHDEENMVSSTNGVGKIG